MGYGKITVTICFEVSCEIFKAFISVEKNVSVAGLAVRAVAYTVGPTEQYVG